MCSEIYIQTSTTVGNTSYLKYARYVLLVGMDNIALQNRTNTKLRVSAANNQSKMSHFKRDED